jgi:hypothetical protein
MIPRGGRARRATSSPLRGLAESRGKFRAAELRGSNGALITSMSIGATTHFRLAVAIGHRNERTDRRGQAQQGFHQRTMATPPVRHGRRAGVSHCYLMRR